MDSMGLILHIGPEKKPGKVSPKLLEVLREAEVMCSLDEPSRCRLVFQVPRYDAKASAKNYEYFFLTGGALAPFHRIHIGARVDQQETALFRGFITAQGMKVEGGDNWLILEGQDLSLKMDLAELSLEYPKKAASAIVKEVLGRYASLGFTSQVVAAKGEEAPSSYVPQQYGTDRAFVRRLAAMYGHDFYLAAAGKEWQAYWGPPVFKGKAQRALSVNFGSKTNVLQLTTREDGLAATQTYASVFDFSKQPAEVASAAIAKPTWTAKLAQQGAIRTSLPKDPAITRGPAAKQDVRGTLLHHVGLEPGAVTRRAQSFTNRSVLYQQRVEGKLDTEVYQHILTAPGLVDLRGIGKRFDGTYMVRQVTHQFTWKMPRLDYTQGFVLARDGRDANIQKVAQI